MNCSCSEIVTFYKDLGDSPLVRALAETKGDLCAARIALERAPTLLLIQVVALRDGVGGLVVQGALGDGLKVMAPIRLDHNQARFFLRQR